MVHWYCCDVRSAVTMNYICNGQATVEHDERSLLLEIPDM